MTARRQYICVGAIFLTVFALFQLVLGCLPHYPG